MTKDNVENSGAEAQARTPTQIEEALFNREIVRLTKAINPLIASIYKVFPDRWMNHAQAERIAAVICNPIRIALINGTQYQQDQLFPDALRDAFTPELKTKLVDRLVTDFLARVEEIGEIAEDAAARAQ